MSIRDAYSPPSCSTCSWKGLCRKHFMTTTQPSPLVEDPYATYSLPMTSILWVAAMVNFLTNRLIVRAMAHGMEVSTEKSKIMTNSTNNISADITMNGQTLGDQFQVPGSNPVQRWHLLSRSLYQDCLSHSSNGQTKQDLVVQHHQLGTQAQAPGKSVSGLPQSRQQWPD